GPTVGGAINIVRVESAEGGVNAAGIGRVNGETGASAIRQVGRAKVLAGPGGVGGSAVGSGINVAVVVTHPDDVGVARGNRDGAVDVAGGSASIAAAMDLEIDIFAVEIVWVGWIGRAVPAVAAEHRGPALRTAAGGVAQRAVVLRAGHDRAADAVAGRAVEFR